MTHSTAVSLYPLAELRRARDDFVVRWHNAMRFDARLRELYDQHCRFPPLIRMVNCTEYPFEQEDTVSQMPPIPTHFKVTTQEPLKAPDPRLRYQLDCKKLTETIFSQPYNYAVGDNDSSFFACDNCSSTFCSQSEAKEHLRLQQHNSCSFYSRLLDPENEDKEVVVLRKPRLVYNGMVPSYSWLSETVVVLCPTCHLILPDKIMCAYHHYSQHNGYLSNYSFCPVMCVRELNITKKLTCHECSRRFCSQISYVNHWLEKDSSCSSPFMPLQSNRDHNLSVHVVQVYCHTCRNYFDRVTPPSTLDAPISGGITRTRKRRHPDEITLPNRHQLSVSADVDKGSNPLALWADGFARFCVNHCCMHLAGGMVDDRVGCKLHIRIIQVNKNDIKTLPPYCHESDLALLLFSIHECKRLLIYLQHMRGMRRSLQRQTNTDLKRLLTVAEVYGV